MRVLKFRYHSKLKDEHMLIEQSIANYLSLQPYEYINTEIAEDGKHRLLHLKSNKETEDVQCPFCNGHVHICGNYSMRLRDMPLL